MSYRHISRLQFLFNLMKTRPNITIKAFKETSRSRTIQFTALSLLQHSRFPLLFMMVAFMEPSNVPAGIANKSIVLSKKQREEVISNADKFFDDGEFLDCLGYLRTYQHIIDPEIQWRLVRAMYNLSKVDKKRNQELVTEAYQIITRTLETNSDHYAVQKWMGILLDAYSGLAGIKTRIAQLYNVKNYFLRTVEINPNDATTWYMLGEWCYQIADMPWYQRQIASALFGTPPTSTFEEALVYFKKAEEVDPLFYSLNLLMLGKTHLKLGDSKMATMYFKKVLEYNKSTNDDIIAFHEATKMIGKLQ